jgi:hypothetical protein
VSEESPELPGQVHQAVNSFSPFTAVNRKWHPYPIDSNYDPDKTLSATLHTIEMATGSSPMHIALYHRGEFRAQGSPQAGAFISIRHDDCTDDTVALRIRIPGPTFPETRSVHNIDYVYRDGQI